MLNSMAVRPVPTPWGESSTALSPIQSASTRRSAGYGVPSRWPRGRGQGCTALELGESTALFSLSSDGGGGEGRGEESRFYWISPLPNPPPLVLAGRGRPTLRVPILNSMAVAQDPRQRRGPPNCLARVGCVLLNQSVRANRG